MEPKQPTSHLVERAQKGDREAFALLTDAHRGSLEALAQARMSPELRRRVEVADVVQETLTRALESIAQFRWEGEESFARWLKGIARNVILKAARTHSIRLEPGESWEATDGSPSVSRVLRREERFERLEAALEALTPEQQEVVRLARFQGLKASEIAARTGRTENAVKQLMLRALRSLRKKVGETESLHLPDRSLEPPESEAPEPGRESGE